jgi:hypothetical protein
MGRRDRMTDIVERLRAWGIVEAADEIKRVRAALSNAIDVQLKLQAEIERWRGLHREARSEAEHLADGVERLRACLKAANNEQQAEIERLLAENKELRVKLEQAEIYISDAADASER